MDISHAVLTCREHPAVPSPQQPVPSPAPRAGPGIQHPLHLCHSSHGQEERQRSAPGTSGWSRAGQSSPSQCSGRPRRLHALERWHWSVGLCSEWSHVLSASAVSPGAWIVVTGPQQLPRACQKFGILSFKLKAS
eukprot:scaffold15997_cov19-Tisochrysis_lutea.AAC.1